MHGKSRTVVLKYLPYFEEGTDYIKVTVEEAVKIAKLNNASEEEISDLLKGKRTDAACYIMLSIDCAKKLAMRARGPYADQIRLYFIQMEKGYRRYLEYGIKQRLKEEDPEVTKSKRYREPVNERPSIPPGPGAYIYGNEHKQKVGSTDDFMKNRYAEARRLVPGPATILHWEPIYDNQFFEDCLKIGLDKYAEGHELFHAPTDAREVALRICRKRTNGIREEIEHELKKISK